MASGPPTVGCSAAEINHHVELTKAFMSRTNPETKPTRLDIKSHEHFLTSMVVRRPPVAAYLPADNVDLRKDLIAEIYKECETLANTTGPRSKLRAPLVSEFFWSLLQTMDPKSLSALLKQAQKDSKRSVPINDATLYRLASNCSNIVDLFMKIPTSAKTGDIKRSSSQPDIARERDGYKCIITGWQVIEVCHIYPFHAINRTGDTFCALSQMDRGWGGTHTQSLRKKLAIDGKTNTIDTASNMVCLCRPGHKMWTEGLFSLEPLNENIDYLDHSSPGPPVKVYGIRMRFHWLPKTKHGPKVNFAADPRRILEPELRRARMLNTDGRPVETGQIIDVFSTDKSLLPDRDILQFQHNVLRMSALAGGADPSVYWSHWHRPDDDGQRPAVPAGPMSSEPSSEIFRSQVDTQHRQTYGPPPPSKNDNAGPIGPVDVGTSGGDDLYGRPAPIVEHTAEVDPDDDIYGKPPRSPPRGKTTRAHPASASGFFGKLRHIGSDKSDTVESPEMPAREASGTRSVFSRAVGRKWSSNVLSKLMQSTPGGSGETVTRRETTIEERVEKLEIAAGLRKDKEPAHPRPTDPSPPSRRGPSSSRQVAPSTHDERMSTYSSENMKAMLAAQTSDEASPGRGGSGAFRPASNVDPSASPRGPAGPRPIYHSASQQLMGQQHQQRDARMRDSQTSFLGRTAEGSHRRQTSLPHSLHSQAPSEGATSSRSSVIGVH